MKSAIIIICYNTAAFLPRQVESFRKFCLDPDVKIIVVDNSTDSQAIIDIKYHAEINGCWYVKTIPQTKSPSWSHSFACNVIFQTYKNTFDFLFYVDHDLFAIKPFSIKETLKNNVLAGIEQKRHLNREFSYLWPGCMMFNMGLVNKDWVDFSPKEGLDTGGSMHIFIDNHKPSEILYFTEEYGQNEDFNKNIYNFYSLIYDKTFMHFICGSNWAEQPDHEERINSLFNLLEKNTNAK